MKTVFFLLLSSLLLGAQAVQAQRIFPGKLPQLVFHENSHTTKGRGASIPQMECVGGHCDKAPSYIRCTNMRLRQGGEDPEWDCKANLEKGYHLVFSEVSCEGYAYAEDPYILAGSCGVTYKVGRSPFGLEHPAYVFTLFFVLGVIMLYVVVTGNTDAEDMKRRLLREERLQLSERRQRYARVRRAAVVQAQDPTPVARVVRRRRSYSPAMRVMPSAPVIVEDDSPLVVHRPEPVLLPIISRRTSAHTVIVQQDPPIIILPEPTIIRRPDTTAVRASTVRRPDTTTAVRASTVRRPDPPNPDTHASSTKARTTRR